MIKCGKLISLFHQKTSERITDGLFLSVSILQKLSKANSESIPTRTANEAAFLLGHEIIIISLFQEDITFGTNASLTYGPRLQR